MLIKLKHLKYRYKTDLGTGILEGVGNLKKVDEWSSIYHLSAQKIRETLGLNVVDNKYW